MCRIEFQNIFLVQTWFNRSSCYLLLFLSLGLFLLNNRDMNPCRVVNIHLTKASSVELALFHWSDSNSANVWNWDILCTDFLDCSGCGHFVDVLSPNIVRFMVGLPPILIKVKVNWLEFLKKVQIGPTSN